MQKPVFRSCITFRPSRQDYFGVDGILNRSFASYGQLVSVASEVKKKAKGISGNSFCLDQRQA